MIRYYLLLLMSHIYCSQMVTLINDKCFYIIYDEDIRYASITKIYNNTTLTIKVEDKVEEIQDFKELYDIKGNEFLARPRMYKFEISNLKFKDAVMVLYNESHKQLFNIKLESKDDNLFVTKIKFRDFQDGDEISNMFYTFKYKVMDKIPFAFVLSESIEEKVKLDKSLEYCEVLLVFKDIMKFLSSIYTNLINIYGSAEQPIKKMIFDDFKQILFIFDTIRIMTRAQYNSFMYETSILEKINKENVFEYHYLAEMTNEMIENEFLEKIENLLNDLKDHYESISLSETTLNLINLSIAEYKLMKCRIFLSFNSFTRRDSSQDEVFRNDYDLSDHDYTVKFKFLKKFGKLLNDYSNVKVKQYFMEYSYNMEDKFTKMFKKWAKSYLKT